MGFEFNPSFWFLCGKCKEGFSNTDDLKKHKLETHLEDCIDVKCIIFQEIHEPGPQLIFQLPSLNAASDLSSSLSPLGSSKRKAEAENAATNCTNTIYKESNNCCRPRKNPYIDLKPLTQEEINRVTKTTDSVHYRESVIELEPQSILNQQSVSDVNLTFPDLKERAENYSCLNLDQSVNNQNQFGMPNPFNVMFENALNKGEPPSLSTTTVEEIIADPLALEPTVPTQSSASYSSQGTSPYVIHSNEENDGNGNSSDSSIEICMEISPIINPSLPILSRCKLCRTPLETADQAKNHEENCLLHNKDRHIYCFCCEREFKTPMKLQKHLLKHNELQVIDPDSKLLRDSDDDDDDEIDEENDDLLPIGQWIEKRRRNFADEILLVPELASDSNLEGKCRIKCKLCSRIFLTVDKLKQHVKTCWVYNKKNHRYCLPCQKSFYGVQALISHNRMFHPFKPLPLPSVYCLECYKEFDNFKKLKQHEDSALIFFRAMVGIKEGKQVESERASQNKTKTVERRRYTDYDRKDDDDVPITPIPCMLCREKLVTKKEAMTHRDNCLVHNKDRHVYCLGCHTKFQNPLMLKQHQYQNQREGPGQGRNHCAPICFPEDIKWAKTTLAEMENNPTCKPEMNHDLNLDLDLPLGRWVLKMREIIPDTILLDPDPTREENLLKPKCITPSRPITCKLCLNKLITESQAKVHVLTCWAYNKQNHHHCLPCKTTFRDTKSFRKHCRNHHPYKSPPLPSFFCVECHEEFRIHEDLNKHMQSAGRFYGLVRKRLLQKL